MRRRFFYFMNERWDEEGGSWRRAGMSW
jgi:hypothetical protein